MARPDERRRGQPRRWRRRPQGMPRLAARPRHGTIWPHAPDGGRARDLLPRPRRRPVHAGRGARRPRLLVRGQRPRSTRRCSSSAGWALIGCGVVALGTTAQLDGSDRCSQQPGFAWFMLEWNNPGSRLGARVHRRALPLRLVPAARRARRALVRRRAGVGSRVEPARGRFSPTPLSSSASGFCPRSSSTLPAQRLRAVSARTSCSSPTGAELVGRPQRASASGHGARGGDRCSPRLVGPAAPAGIDVTPDARSSVRVRSTSLSSLRPSCLVARPWRHSRTARSERRLWLAQAAALVGADARRGVELGARAPRARRRRAPRHRPRRGAATRRPPRRARRDRGRPDARGGLSARGHRPARRRTGATRSSFPADGERSRRSSRRPPRRRPRARAGAPRRRSSSWTRSAARRPARPRERAPARGDRGAAGGAPRAPAPASSTPPMPSGAGSSGTCTTAPSSASSDSRSTLAARALAAPCRRGAHRARSREADAELRAAVEELRELAHGLYPVRPRRRGRRARRSRRLPRMARVPDERSAALPDGRFAPAVETAAYTVVAEVARAARSGLSRFGADAGRQRCWSSSVETRGDGREPTSSRSRDRLGALDGSLDRRASGRRLASRFHAEVPCAL